jgi:hypothetical protein
MDTADRSPTGATPRIIPWRPHGSPERDGQSLRGVIAGLAAEVARSIRGLPIVRISVDVGDAHVADAEPEIESLAAPLRRLMTAACAAAAAPAPASEFPRPREVVVTSVDTGDALEIEVADSAADVSRQEAVVAELRPQVEHLGWTLSSAPCPEGGLAVTLRMPRRRRRSLAA